MPLPLARAERATQRAARGPRWASSAGGVPKTCSDGILDAQSPQKRTPRDARTEERLGGLLVTSAFDRVLIIGVIGEGARLDERERRHWPCSPHLTGGRSSSPREQSVAQCA